MPANITSFNNFNHQNSLLKSNSIMKMHQKIDYLDKKFNSNIFKNHDLKRAINLKREAMSNGISVKNLKKKEVKSPINANHFGKYFGKNGIEENEISINALENEKKKERKDNKNNKQSIDENKEVKYYIDGIVHSFKNRKNQDYFKKLYRNHFNQAIKDILIIKNFKINKEKKIPSVILEKKKFYHSNLILNYKSYLIILKIFCR